MGDTVAEVSKKGGPKTNARKSDVMLKNKRKLEEVRVVCAWKNAREAAGEDLQKGDKTSSDLWSRDMGAVEGRREEAGKFRDEVLRRAMGASIREHLRNEDVRGRAGAECITDEIRKSSCDDLHNS